MVSLPLNNVNLISLFKEPGLEIFTLYQQPHSDCGHQSILFTGLTSFSLVVSLSSMACSFWTISCCFSWPLARSLSSKLVCLRCSCSFICCSLNRIIPYDNNTQNVSLSYFSNCSFSFRAACNSLFVFSCWVLITESLRTLKIKEDKRIWEDQPRSLLVSCWRLLHLILWRASLPWILAQWASCQTVAAAGAKLFQLQPIVYICHKLLWQQNSWQCKQVKNGMPGYPGGYSYHAVECNHHAMECS